MSNIHIQETYDVSPRVKKALSKADIPVPFSYFPSDDGTDENLLLLLHGLGTDAIFSSPDDGIECRIRGYSFTVQQPWASVEPPSNCGSCSTCTATWYTSFDDFGETIQWPNPTPALDLLDKVVNRLIDGCGWLPHRIHLFGFAQGGSVAAEFGIKWWKQHLASQISSDSPSSGSKGTLGSIISISGPLLSYPTPSAKKSSTPTLIVHALPPAETALSSGAVADIKKAYDNVTEKATREPGMPSSKAGWQPIMQFWSTYLGRRQMDGLYEVMSGTAAPSS
ncbi:hypothetical protein H0H87_012819 [Tephrocybe sp. NHM501043]|nr:hypothetical protein H0H87_012819 [Tephrocybe sp. NHM501043]